MATHKTIRVLIAEDSPTVRHYLITLLAEVPGLEVIGEARDGREAIRLTEELRPDIVSMDISMPQLDGLEATRQIMTRCPTPIVVVSSLVDDDVDLSFRALQAGALAVVPKPPDRQNADFSRRQQELIKTLKAMAGVRVVSRRPSLESADGGRLASASPKHDKSAARPRPELIAIGASTGGPSALGTLLQALAHPLPVPIVVVQHMSQEFLTGLARWLHNVAQTDVTIARDGEELLAGRVYLAPGTAHLTVIRRGTALIARLLTAQGHYRHQPSVDALFYSVAQTCGSAAAGIILTGMGDDGANGLLAMYRAGAWTYAQDETSSTIFGMPNAAINLGAAQVVASLKDLPSEIAKII